jgi:hypothetical protein
MPADKPIGYQLVPVYPAEPGTIQTAALMECMVTGKMLDSSGGGMRVISPEVYAFLNSETGRKLITDMAK